MITLRIEIGGFTEGSGPSFCTNQCYRTLDSIYNTVRRYSNSTYTTIITLFTLIYKIQLPGSNLDNIQSFLIFVGHLVQRIHRPLLNKIESVIFEIYNYSIVILEICNI